VTGKTTWVRSVNLWALCLPAWGRCSGVEPELSRDVARIRPKAAPGDDVSLPQGKPRVRFAYPATLAANGHTGECQVINVPSASF
jgi:hypothetical protein